MRIVWLAFGDLCGKTKHSRNKTVFDHTCAVFDAGKLVQKLLESRAGVEPPPKVTNTHRNENHQTVRFSILLRLQKDLLKNVLWSRRFVFVCLLWGPWGRFARSAKHLLLSQPPPPGTQTPQSLYSCSATTPNHSASSFLYFYDLHSAAFFARFSKILASIKDFLKKQASKFQRSSEKSSNVLVSLKDSSKKQASQLLSCRGGLGEAPYNTPRHSLQRCRSKALWNGGIRKLTLFEITYLKILKGF